MKGIGWCGSSIDGTLVFIGLALGPLGCSLYIQKLDEPVEGKYRVELLDSSADSTTDGIIASTSFGSSSSEST